MIYLQLNQRSRSNHYMYKAGVHFGFFKEFCDTTLLSRSFWLFTLLLGGCFDSFTHLLYHFQWLFL